MLQVHHVVAGGQAHFIAVASKEITEGCEITIPFDYDYKKWYAIMFLFLHT
jgi:hypothetical protein